MDLNAQLLPGEAGQQGRERLDVADLCVHNAEDEMVVARVFGERRRGLLREKVNDSIVVAASSARRQ
eukprot:3719124-Lingulodinium_polyedra.AAC.1